MPQEWIGVRELARRCGRKHRAVQKAVEDGRIPADAVRRDSDGRIVAIEYHRAAHAWADRTDLDQMLRSSVPLRTPAAAPVQTPARSPCAGDWEGGHCADLIAFDLECRREAMQVVSALELAFIAIPTELRELGAAEGLALRLLERLQARMLKDLLGRRIPESTARELCDRVFEMALEEHARPGVWTT